VTSILET